MFAKRPESSPKGLLDPQNSVTQQKTYQRPRGPQAPPAPPGACSLLGTRQAELRREEREVDAERAPLRASPQPGSPWSRRSRYALARETVSDLPGRLEGSGKFSAVFRGKQVLFGHQHLRGAQNEVECWGALPALRAGYRDGSLRHPSCVQGAGLARATRGHRGRRGHRRADASQPLEEVDLPGTTTSALNLKSVIPD